VRRGHDLDVPIRLHCLQVDQGDGVGLLIDGDHGAGQAAFRLRGSGHGADGSQRRDKSKCAHAWNLTHFPNGCHLGAPRPGTLRLSYTEELCSRFSSPLFP
jgi:hypothetical protein